MDPLALLFSSLLLLFLLLFVYVSSFFPFLRHSFTALRSSLHAHRTDVDRTKARRIGFASLPFRALFREGIYNQVTHF